MKRSSLPPLDDPRALEAAIKASPEATANVLSYLDLLGVGHSGQISGATLGAICVEGDHAGRTWRRWIGGERAFPAAAGRLLRLVAFGA